MKSGFLILVPIVIVIFHLSAFAQTEQAVKLGDLKLTVESIEVKTGLEIVSKKDKDGPSFPPFNPGWLEESGDTTRLAFVDWLSFGKKYLVLKFVLTNEGDSNPIFVSPTVRFDGVLKAADESGKILKQARIYPESRPDYCPKPGVNRIAKGEKVEDLFIIEVPPKEAKKAVLEILGTTILPEIGGILKIEVPMDGGKPAFACTLKFDYEPEKKEEKELKCRGKIKFGRVQIEVEKVQSKNLNILDKEVNMVFTILEQRTVIKLKLTNSGSKPVKYKPILLQEALPGIAVDHQGKWCGMVGIQREVKLVECFDMKESIPAKGESVDYVVLNPPAGAESIRLVLIAESLLPDVKSGGIMIFNIIFKNNEA